MLLRCNIGLKIYFLPNKAIFYNATTYKVYDAGMINSEVFLGLIKKASSEWIERKLLEKWLIEKYNIESEKIKSHVDKLLSLKILVYKDSFDEEAFLGHNVWKAHNWEESFNYHWHSYNANFLDWSKHSSLVEDVGRMKKFLSEEEPPLPYKTYPDSDEILLPYEKDNENRGYGDVVNKPNLNNNAKLNLKELGQFLKLGFGQTGIRKLPATGEHITKTSPSGGSRHPTECYPIILNVEGLKNGLYHYNVKNHSLEFLDDCCSEQFLLDNVYLLPNRMSFKPSITCILTTIFERSMFRYRDARSYRVVHFDIGHVLQTASLVANSLGRSSYHSYTLNDSVVDTYLNEFAMNESSMAFISMG